MSAFQASQWLTMSVARHQEPTARHAGFGGRQEVQAEDSEFPPTRTTIGSGASQSRRMWDSGQVWALSIAVVGKVNVAQ